MFCVIFLIFHLKKGAKRKMATRRYLKAPEDFCRDFSERLTARTPPPISVVAADCPPVPGRDIHRHDYHELRIALGSGTADAASIEVVFPGVCHHSLVRAEYADSLILALHPDQVLDCTLRGRDSWCFVSRYDTALLRTAERLREDSGETLRRELRLLLALLFLSAEFPDASHPADRIEHLRLRLRNLYYRHDLSIAEEAARIGYSPNYVQKIFRAKTGMSPKEYLMKIRMEEARRFLKDRRYSVKEVASLCGFSGKEYFSTAFRAYYGFPPSGCR